MLRLAEQADAADVPDGMDIPDELARRKERLEAIASAKEEISRRAQERYIKEKAEYERKMANRKEKEKSSGKKVPKLDIGSLTRRISAASFANKCQTSFCWWPVLE